MITDIQNVLQNPKIMANPHRPIIMYEDLMENVIESEEGWEIVVNGAAILFVHKKTGQELLHDTLFELMHRYNGAAIPPHKHRGFKV